MRMIGSLRRMFAQHHPAQIYERAARGDHAFFAAQYAPLAAIASTENGLPVVMLSQREAVRDLDADHAVIVPGEQGPRVFGTEVGMNVMAGTPNHFFVEFDPYAVGPATRKGNYGDIDVPDGDALAILRALAAKAFEIIGVRAAPPHAAETARLTDHILRATDAIQRGDLVGAAAELERGAREREGAGDHAMAATLYRELASLRRDMRDPSGALEASDRALAIVPPSDNPQTFAIRAAVFDDLEQPAAIAAWGDAARWAPSPERKLAYEAHAVGATLRHDARQTELARQLVARLGATPDPAVLATVLGAIGTSAGKAGTGYLAQVAWLMFHVDDLFTTDNVGVLDTLVQRVGPTTEDGYMVCALILLRMLANKDAPSSDQDASVKAIGIVDRVAKARGITRQGLLQVVARDDNAFVKIDYTLESLAARTPWLIPRP